MEEIATALRQLSKVFRGKGLSASARISIVYRRQPLNASLGLRLAKIAFLGVGAFGVFHAVRPHPHRMWDTAEHFLSFTA